jgi:hypothetical protein
MESAGAIDHSFSIVFFFLVTLGVVAWLVAVVSIFRLTGHPVEGPLKGPAFLRKIDTFRWIFGKDLVLPVLYPENLTPQGARIRRRLIAAFVIFMTVCIVSVAAGLILATRHNAG